MDIEKLKKKMKRQIERNNAKIKVLEDKKEKLSIHGHFDLGYLKGVNSTLENILDDLE